MSDLEMRHLESFLAVAEEGSFTRAALRLHITQPPLSLRIRELEAMLKLTLFDRTTRRVRLTSAGQMFLEKVQVMMQALNTAVAAARQVDQGVMGRLRVGFTSIASDSVLPRLIREFHSLYSKIALDIVGPSTTGQLGLSLLNNEIDCALCFLPLADERLQSRTLITTELALVLPDNHRLARARRVSLKDVAEEPFVTYPANGGSHLRAAVDAEWARAGYRPKIVRESRWSQTLLCLVAAGIGIAILPKEQQKRGIEGLKFLPLHPTQAPVHHGIVWRKGDTNPSVGNFLSVAQKSFPQGKKSLSLV
ncbi:MAG: LysR family transcriptional regulator [Candidatus Korobacteraceae bacterium]